MPKKWLKVPPKTDPLFALPRPARAVGARTHCSRHTRGLGSVTGPLFTPHGSSVHSKNQPCGDRVPWRDERSQLCSQLDNLLSKSRPRVDMLWIITYRHRMPSFFSHISRYVRYKPVTHQKRSTIAQNQPREIDQKYDHW